MSEETSVYRGSPSPVINLGTLLTCLIVSIGAGVAVGMFWNELNPTWLRYVGIAVAVIPLFIFLGNWMLLRTVVYEITSERIKVRRGLFSKRTDELELYRVQDTTLIEPFIFRMFGVGNIILSSADATTPNFEVKGIKNAPQVREELRKNIELCRDRKRTRVAEME